MAVPVATDAYCENLDFQHLFHTGQFGWKVHSEISNFVKYFTILLVLKALHVLLPFCVIYQKYFVYIII